MFALRRGTLYFSQRFSTSALACGLENYKAVNEPVLEFLPGSKERKELEAKLKKYGSKTHEIPIVIDDDEFTTGDVKYQVRPFDHQNKLAKYYWADRGLLEKAIIVTQKVQRDWEKKPQEERSEIFLKAADLISGKYRMDLLAATMLGQAKTIIQAEIDAACELADFYRFNVQYYADMFKFQPISVEGVDNRLIYRGMEGFWAAIAPFNFTAISGHLAGAPAFMGNTVVWKPSDTSVLSSYIVFKILLEAGVPHGVINFVPAEGHVFGDVMTESPFLAGINFTGSARTFHTIWKEVAKNIEHYKGFPRLVGECGGKNFHLVHTSADAQSVINGTLKSAFEYGGQKCSACSRLYVPASRWEEIKEGLLTEVKKIKMGSPLEASSFLSAVIDDKAFKRIKTYIDYAKSSKYIDVLAGGNCDDSVGYYVEPTIIQVTYPDDRIMQDEIFGPVLAVYVYPDAKYSQVLEMIDSTSPYGLTGAVYAEDPKVVEEVADVLRYASGNFYINDKCTGSVVAQQPFGGARKSGTNDKAGGPHYLLKFASPQAIKQSKVPAREWTYKYMQQ